MIDFQTENVELPRLDYSQVGRWIRLVASRHGRRVGDISYRFCDDEYIIDANRKFLGHDYFTDVITFDYSRGDLISGDILISLDTVSTNAEGVGTTFRLELLRVIIHGVLHLCGINDKGPGEREVMEQHEDDALSLFEEI